MSWSPICPLVPAAAAAAGATCVLSPGSIAQLIVRVCSVCSQPFSHLRLDIGLADVPDQSLLQHPVRLRSDPICLGIHHRAAVHTLAAHDSPFEWQCRALSSIALRVVDWHF